MGGRAEVVRHDRMLAVLPLTGVAAVAAVQAARVAEPPVPAARRREQVAPERAHVPELRRGREPARLAERVRDLRIDLELCERRARADRRALDPTWHDLAHVHEPVGLEQALA